MNEDEQFWKTCNPTTVRTVKLDECLAPLQRKKRTEAKATQGSAGSGSRGGV